MIALSSLFNEEIGLAFPEPMDELDKAFVDQLQFVFNQSIQALRKTGWTRETLVTVGQMLYRLYQVFQQYKNRKTYLTMAQWLQRLVEIGGEINGAIGTAPSHS